MRRAEIVECFLRDQFALLAIGKRFEQGQQLIGALDGVQVDQALARRQLCVFAA